MSFEAQVLSLGFFFASFPCVIVFYGIRFFGESSSCLSKERQEEKNNAKI